jgi:hypothetical protein
VDYASSGVPLAFSFFPYFVIAGIEKPAIKAAKRLKQKFGLADVTGTSAWTAGSKSGGDEEV